MKPFLKLKLAVSSFFVFSFILLSCKKQDSDSASANSTAPVEAPKKSSNRPESDAQSAVPERKASSEYETLPKLIGRSLPPEILTLLNAESRPLPEFDGTLIKGAKIFVLAPADRVPMTVCVKGSTLVMVGYVFPASSLSGDVALERGLLDDYVFEAEDFHEVLGADLNTVKIPIRKYRGKRIGNGRAVAFTNRGSMSLALYDSSVVNYESLLPASPAAIGKEKIDKMKAEMARLEALRERAKADQKAPRTKSIE